MSASTSPRWSSALTREHAVVRLVARVCPSQQWRGAAEWRGHIRLALDHMAASTDASDGTEAISS